MNRFSKFPLRWLLFIGLFILTFSLTIQHIVNGQGDGEEGFRLRLSEGRKNAPPQPTPTIAAPPSSTLPDDATQNLLKRLPAINCRSSICARSRNGYRAGILKTRENRSWPTRYTCAA